jgi:processive 1,2-diacylglycerol beta-glucosyltransferase
MKKIAIITTSEGGGHNAAAYALSEVIKHKFPQNEVKVFDIHDYLDKTTRVGLISSYLAIVEHLPILWKYIYHTSNGVSGNKAFTKGIELIARFSAKKLIEAITLFKPTDIIATHFFAPYFIQGTPWEKIPMSVVVTDYGWHAAWYHPLFSHYFVATPEIKKEIIHTFSINSNAITVSGIPVSPRFFESKDQKNIKKTIQNAS